MTLSHVGLHYRATDLSMSALEFALAGEARGFGSLYLAEHTHIPVEQRAPGSSRSADGGRVMVRQEPLRTAAAPGLSRYQRIFDPYTTLAFLAPQTHMRLGTCISLVAQHDPIILAKMIASLDHYCDGRFRLGVGTGWIDEEFANHGLDPRRRLALLREKVLVMKALWTQEEASFDGEFIHLTPSFAWPKPVQRPHPPIFLGCRPRRTGFGEVASWADGWIPVDFHPYRTLREDLGVLNCAWQDAGREGLPRVIVVQDAEISQADFQKAMAIYNELGVEEVLLDVPTDTSEVLLPELDRIAGLLAF